MIAARTARVLALSAAIGIAAAPARAQQWQPPIGIPSPAFGIAQTAPAAPSPWTTETPGFYYVEQKAGATNINNPYGTPAKPRISIPNVLPAGSVVELHGFYDQGHSSPNTLVGQGTASRPVFIRGVSATNRPIIRRFWEVTGTYVILENVEFGPMPDQSATGSLAIRAPSNFIALRNSELHGTLTDGGLGIVNWNNGLSATQNIVIYNNAIHDNGDVNADYDQDVHGITVGEYVHDVWVLDNKLYRNSGDGIQINATRFMETTHHIYVGRNVAHHNKQSGFATKQARDVIFSQNVAYSHRPGNSSNGACMGEQYNPDYVWWIANFAFDCEFGIVQMSDIDAEKVTHTYFVANVIFNIHKTTSPDDPDSPWSPAGIFILGGFERHVVNNTIYNVDSGVNIPAAVGSVEVKNNIINNVTQGSGNHVNFRLESVAKDSAMNHNLLYPSPRLGLGGQNYLLSPAEMTAMKSIAQNPQFRNAAAADFHISSTSPAAAAGELSAVYSVFQQRYGISIFVDPDGSPRPQTSWMDMGAYSSTGWGLLAVDSPAPNAVVGRTSTVSGWAIDRAVQTGGGTGVDGVAFYLTPSGGAPLGPWAATYGLQRPDVGAAFGSQFTASGYSFNLPDPPYGPYTLSVYGHSLATGGFTLVSVIPINVSGPAPQPAMALDRPASNRTSGSTVRVSGWAIDRAGLSGTGVDEVDVWAYPTAGGAATFMGVATYGLSRPDIGVVFGNSRFTNSGFQIAAPLPPGNYTITAHLHSQASGTFTLNASATNVTVIATASNPLMNIDTPTAGVSRTRPFAISGWAVDEGASSGPGIDAIHVWAFPVAGGSPIFVGQGTYGLSRPDVGAYLGSSQFNNSGYSGTVNSSNLPSAGTYDFWVFAHSTVTGNFSIAKSVRVTVQ